MFTQYSRPRWNGTSSPYLPLTSPSKITCSLISICRTECKPLQQSLPWDIRTICLYGHHPRWTDTPQGQEQCPWYDVCSVSELCVHHISIASEIGGKGRGGERRRGEGRDGRERGRREGREGRERGEREKGDIREGRKEENEKRKKEKEGKEEGKKYGKKRKEKKVREGGRETEKKEGREGGKQKDFKKCLAHPTFIMPFSFLHKALFAGAISVQAHLIML